jgi:hypothetical protein
MQVALAGAMMEFTGNWLVYLLLHTLGGLKLLWLPAVA